MRDATPLDRLFAQAAERFAPGVLTEEQWQRRVHADLSSLETWQLRHELFVLTRFLETPLGRGHYLRAWFCARVQKIRGELAHRSASCGGGGRA